MKTNKVHFSNGLIRNISFILLITALACEGPRGYDGRDGEDGTFSYSAMFEVLATDWTGDFNGYSATLPMAELTETIYEHGAVLVYWMNDAAGSFTILPYWYLDEEEVITNLACDVYIGDIALYYQEIFEGLADTFAPTGTWYFKVVIIEALDITAVKKMVDISDYSAVAKTFNVHENPINMKVY
jgi:hypothetical protein